MNELKRIPGPVPAVDLRDLYGLRSGSKIRVEMSGEGSVKANDSGKVCFDGVVVQAYPRHMTIYRPSPKEAWTGKEREGRVESLDYAGIHCGRFQIHLI